jgi:hypothetical protein
MVRGKGACRPRAALRRGGRRYAPTSLDARPPGPARTRCARFARCARTCAPRSDERCARCARAAGPPALLGASRVAPPGAGTRLCGHRGGVRRRYRRVSRRATDARCGGRCVEEILTHRGFDPQSPPKARAREAGQDFAPLEERIAALGRGAEARRGAPLTSGPFSRRRRTRARARRTIRSPNSSSRISSGLEMLYGRLPTTRSARVPASEPKSKGAARSRARGLPGRSLSGLQSSKTAGQGATQPNRNYLAPVRFEPANLIPNNGRGTERVRDRQRE